MYAPPVLMVSSQMMSDQLNNRSVMSVSTLSIWYQVQFNYWSMIGFSNPLIIIYILPQPTVDLVATWMCQTLRVRIVRLAPIKMLNGRPHVCHVITEHPPSHLVQTLKTYVCVSLVLFSFKFKFAMYSCNNPNYFWAMHWDWFVFIDLCPPGYEEDPTTPETCRPCPIGFYKDNDTPGESCVACNGDKADFITPSNASVANSDCTIRMLT